MFIDLRILYHPCIPGMNPTCISFSFTRLGKFWSLFLQLGSQFLAHSLLLLVSPSCRCCYASCCPECFLNSLHFLFIYFLFLLLYLFFFLPCLPNHRFNPLPYLTYCLFLPMYYLFQILHSLFLTGPFLLF